jgi:hypothetical protein
MVVIAAGHPMGFGAGNLKNRGEPQESSPAGEDLPGWVESYAAAVTGGRMSKVS